MELCVIGDETKKTKLWGSLLSNSFPDYQVTQLRTDNLLDYEITKMDIAVFLMSKFNEVVQSVIEMFNALNVPILCIVEKPDFAKIHDKLFLLGVKGILNANAASMNNIRTAIRLVINGGVYIESPPNPSLSSNFTTTTTFDLNEWQVFSLTAKGLKDIEISKVLQLPLTKVQAYQNDFRNIYQKYMLQLK